MVEMYSCGKVPEHVERLATGWLCFAAIFLMVLALPVTAETNTTHWAFSPLVRPSIPDGPQTSAIDRFVSCALAKKGVAPAREADRRTLIRRLSFDLRGLPPSPEEVAEFLRDRHPDAFERLIRRFLDSRQYGQRWGRHWLDIAGYADSNGYFNADSDRPLAWKYRDYVVRSLNADKPLDRFIREQIAGDELVAYVAGGDITPEMIDPLIATHFWRNAPDGTTESDGNPLEVKVDKYAVLEGNVQILGSAFLGLTLQCARCHDHKFEPITQAEYYGLQAILRPAFDPDHWLKPNERALEIGLRTERDTQQRLTAEADRDLKTLKESLDGLTAPFRKQQIDENLAPLDASLRKAIREALDAREKDRTDAMKSLLKTNSALVEITSEALQKKFPAFAAAAETLRQAIKKCESEKPAPLERIAAAFEPTNSPPTHHLLVRGNHAREGKEVSWGTPAILNPHPNDSVGEKLALTPALSPEERERDQERIGSLKSSGRRLALADWLTSSNNPIVARVLVNRIWHYHFGQGLVATLDNLGQSGARPASQELLDCLATELVNSGWSLKHLHRLILTSAAWKQEPAAREGDSAILGSSLQRLDAESLRDAMLAVSGELDLAAGGAYVPTKTDKQGQVIVDEKQPGAYRRSIYLQQRRTAPVSFLSTFDGPAHNPVCIQRVSSTVALQSLTLLNSEFVRLRAQAFARRIIARMKDEPRENTNSSLSPAQIKAGIQYAFETAYSRPPTAKERSAARKFLQAQGGFYQTESEALVHVWTDFCQMLLASNAFLYVD
jgi:hypothetical protein